MGDNARVACPGPPSLMSVFRLFFVVVLLVALAEIYLFAKVGQLIGATNTVLLVVLTAFVGVVLLRLQGFVTVNRVRGALARGELPALPLLEGFGLLVAGGLLLLPGFLTDAVGLALFVPGIRRAVIRRLVGSSLMPRPPVGPAPERRGPRVIEGEVTRRDD